MLGSDLELDVLATNIEPVSSPGVSDIPLTEEDTDLNKLTQCVKREGLNRLWNQNDQRENEDNKLVMAFHENLNHASI